MPLRQHFGVWFDAVNETSYQCFKAFMVVIYDSRVVLTRKLPILRYGVVIYDRKISIRLATGFEFAP